MSPPRLASDATTSISSSSIGSHLSPVTPKSLNELSTRSPDDPQTVATNRNTTNTQQQITNLVPQLNHSLVFESPQQRSNVPNKDHRESSTPPTVVRTQAIDSNQHQQRTNNGVTNMPNDTSNISNNSNLASPSNSTNLPPNNNNNINNNNNVNSTISTPAMPNGALNNSSHTRENSVNCASPLENIPTVIVPRIDGPNRDSVQANTPRPTDVHSQRTRRSSRNLEDSSRRRSSRNTRQSTSNAPAVSLVRSGTAFTRPSMDLPPGYGNPFASYNLLLFPFCLDLLIQFDFVFFYHQKCEQHIRAKCTFIIFQLVYRHGTIHEYHEISIHKI